MPLPTPRNKEKKGDFVNRCMGDLSDKGEFDDNKQRAAVCYDIFKDSESKASIVAGEGDDKVLYFAESDERHVTKTKKQWDKIDKKELKKDTKKQKEKHEKDAVEDDKNKLQKLKKGEPSEKKKAEKKDGGGRLHLRLFFYRNYNRISARKPINTFSVRNPIIGFLTENLLIVFLTEKL